MAKTLVIAEKPSVGRDYAKALPGSFADHKDYLESDDHVVSWAVGHLVELAEPEDYDSKYRVWSLNRLPILPEEFKLQPIEGRTGKQLDALRKLMGRKDVDTIVNGCDAGREGELIFAYIYRYLGSEKPVQRLWVSSMTRDAIREGFDQLRDGQEMLPLEAAARSRGEADWLVGMNGTRAATKVGRLDGVVSLGRVQTPTLALIVRRDLEIDAFVPETYFQVDARFELEGDRAYVGRWFEGKADRTAEREQAEAAATAARGADAVVTSLKKKERRERSPLLYDLTSLQREANRRFGMSASRTLSAAQRLYEGSTNGAVITYPRTRSQFLPKDQIPALKPIAGNLARIPEYRPHAEYVTGLDVLPLARVVNDAKVDDHHAIIPTGELPRGELSGDDRRVYDLVCRRFLAVFHPDARFEDTEVVTEAGGESFRTKGRRLLEAGWRGPAFGDQPPEADRKDDDEAPEQALPRIDEGERGRCTAADVLEKQTKPPGRYTESSLLGAMETAGKQIEDEELREAMKESGLGTPATRADTIERLINVGYIERAGKALESTSKGKLTIELLGTHALTSAELTGRWEKRLTEIEHGQADRSAFMADIAEFTEQIVEYFRSLRAESIGPCPNGDGEIRENRAAFGCSSYQSKSEPGCGFTIWKSQAGFTITREAVAELLADGRAPLNGGAATLVLDENNHALIVGEDGNPLVQSAPIGPCPNCDGEIKENRAAFGCSSYKSKKDPGCGFTIWKNQAGFTVTADQVRALLETGEAELAGGPQPAKLVLTEGNKPQIVDEQGKPLEGTLGPCPNGDGEIRENRAGFGCTSWKSKSDPGCGFTVWKSQRGFTVSADNVREMLDTGRSKLGGETDAWIVLGEGGVTSIVGEDGAPLTATRAARAPRVAIASCPRCDGEIRENSRAFGCSSWKSKKNPGCGFVIWKSTKGHTVSAEEAKDVIEKGHTGPLEFRDRQGPFTGRLVLTDEKAVEVERIESGEAEAAA